MIIPKTKILIIEDHPHYLNGIKNCISKNLKDSEIDFAIDGKTAIEKATSNNFDFILVDLQLPDINGIDVIKVLRSYNILAKFIVNSFYCSIYQIIKLLDLGIDGILQKGDDENDIILAITEIKANNKYFSKAIQSDINKYQQNKNKIDFTSREIAIIQLLKEGLTTYQIANELCITDSTINHHKKNIFNKLGVKNSLELINFCNNNKLF